MKKIIYVCWITLVGFIIVSLILISALRFVLRDDNLSKKEIAFTSCGSSTKTEKEKKWGSFTAEKTNSFDNAFYATQSVQEKDNSRYIVVDVYKTENDKKIYSFSPVRASDFWGICWEKTTYNIWIQSADVGVLCYEYQDGCWELNENAVRPKEIISKYD